MTRNETRRAFLRTAAATVAAGTVAGVASADDDPAVQVSESFTTGDREWTVASDMTTTASGAPYEVTLRSDGWWTSSNHVDYRIDGTADQGTVWITTQVEVEPGQRYEGDLSVNAYSESASYNQLSALRAYVGPDAPRTTDDFPSDRQLWYQTRQVGGLEENPWETAGWSNYSDSWETAGFDTDRVHLAVGFSTRWETEFRNLVDDVELTLTPK